MDRTVNAPKLPFGLPTNGVYIGDSHAVEAPLPVGAEGHQGHFELVAVRHARLTFLASLIGRRLKPADDHRG